MLLEVHIYFRFLIYYDLITVFTKGIHEIKAVINSVIMVTASHKIRITAVIESY